MGCEKLVANFMSFVKLVTINRHSDLKNQSAMDTAVVYLARRKEGLEPLRRFVDTYGKTAAGVPHDLIVIYKGFEWSPQAPRTGFDQYLARRRARNVLRPIERGSVMVTVENRLENTRASRPRLASAKVECLGAAAPARWGTAIVAIWDATERPWLTTFAPIRSRRRFR